MNRTKAPAWYCATKEDWHVVWFSFEAAARTACLLNELAIFYDTETGRWGMRRNELIHVQ